MHAPKPKLLGNRFTIKHALSHIFIRIQAGYTVQYILINLNLKKYMAKKRVLWCIYFQLLGIWWMHHSTRCYGSIFGHILYLKQTRFFILSNELFSFQLKMISHKIFAKFRLKSFEFCYKDYKDLWLCLSGLYPCSLPI